jgi:hypothetical protein
VGQNDGVLEIILPTLILPADAGRLHVPKYCAGADRTFTMATFGNDHSRGPVIVDVGARIWEARQLAEPAENELS